MCLNQSNLRIIVYLYLKMVIAGMHIPHASAAEDIALEQIIVTAQKVEQNILDVPLSISVMQGEMVEENGSTNITDLDGIAPNVILKSVLLLENAGNFSIRGVGFFDIDPLTDQKTQITVDGIPHARNTGLIFDQVDIERMEILRGPQGTLFGRGSLAGTVNYVLRSAADSAGVSVRFSTGEYGMSRYVVTAESGPMFSGNLRGSLTASQRAMDGFTVNAFNNRTLGELDTSNLRMRLDYEGEIAKTSLIAYEVDESVAGLGLTNQIQDPYGVGDGDVNLVNIDQEGFREAKEYGITLLSEISLKSGHLAILANTHESDFLIYADLDARVGNDPPAGSGYPNVPFNFGFDIDQGQESFEIRYHTDTGGRWDLVTGLFLFDEWADRIFYQNTGPPRSESQAFHHAFEIAHARQDTQSIAAFGQARFHLSETMALLVGARMTSEEKSADLLNNLLISSAPETPAIRLTPAGKWEQPTWKLGGEYRPNDATMVYATASTGYKPGGFSGRATLPENAGPYDPEQSTSYELGIKGSLLENRMRFAVAGFLSKYTNTVGLVRRPMFRGRGTEAVHDNLGNMSINGLELESSWLATDDLLFDFAIGYLNAEWDSFYADLNGDGILTDNAHFDIMMAPELSAYGAITYTQELSSSTMQYRLDARYMSRYNTYGRENLDYFYRPSLTKANGSISWIWGDKRNSITIFGKNLTDRQVLSQAIFTVFPVMKFDAPRMLGVEMKINL